MEAEAALEQIRVLADSILTTELRARLMHLPLASDSSLSQPTLVRENHALREQLADALAASAAGKRRRLEEAAPSALTSVDRRRAEEEKHSLQVRYLGLPLPHSLPPLKVSNQRLFHFVCVCPSRRRTRRTVRRGGARAWHSKAAGTALRAT